MNDNHKQKARKKNQTLVDVGWLVGFVPVQVVCANIYYDAQHVVVVEKRGSDHDDEVHCSSRKVKAWGTSELLLLFMIWEEVDPDHTMLWLVACGLWLVVHYRQLTCCLFPRSFSPPTLLVPTPIAHFSLYRGLCP